MRYEHFLRRMAVLLALKCLKNTTTKQKNAHHVQMLPEFGHKIPILSIIRVFAFWLFGAELHGYGFVYRLKNTALIYVVKGYV